MLPTSTAADDVPAPTATQVPAGFLETFDGSPAHPTTLAPDRLGCDRAFARSGDMECARTNAGDAWERLRRAAG